MTFLRHFPYLYVYYNGYTSTKIKNSFLERLTVSNTRLDPKIDLEFDETVHIWLYGLALSQLTTTLKSTSNQSGEEKKLYQITKIQSCINEMINGPALEKVIENPNLMALKFVTQALQIIQ